MKLTTEQRSEIISEMASSEAGFNELMRVLLDCFSKQERALFLEEHKGEQGNGFRPRRWRGHGCSFQLRIPRTRSGAFQPIILGILAAQESERALLFHELYARGLSCEDIAEVGRRIYGHHYSKQQVSRLSGACYEEIQEWLARRLSPHYLAVYIDATFCSTRRDGSVSKEAYYTMLGAAARRQSRGAHGGKSPDRRGNCMGNGARSAQGARCGTNRFDCLRCFARYRKCGVFGFSHDAAPTLRRAFQTEGVEHRFHQRQSRGRRGTQSALSRGAYRHDSSGGL